MDERLTEKQATAVRAIIMGHRYQQRSNPELTLAAYVGGEVASLEASAGNYAAYARASRNDATRESAEWQARRCQRHAALLTGLRDRFESWRGE